MNDKLKKYISDLLDNHDVSSYEDMPDEYKSKCLDIIRADRAQDLSELLIEMMNHSDSLYNAATSANPYRHDVSSEYLANALLNDVERYVETQINECLEAIELGKDEKAIDTSFEDAERTPSRDNDDDWNFLTAAIVNGVKG